MSKSYRRLVRGLGAMALLVVGPSSGANPGLQIEYLTAPRRIDLRPPSSTRRLQCRSDRARIELALVDVLHGIDSEILKRLAGSRPTAWLQEIRADMLKQSDSGTVADCTVLDSLVADLLEAGRGAVLDETQDAYLSHVLLTRVAWNTHAPGCEYSGDGRIFTRESGRYEPGANMQGCGPDCVFQSVDHSMHVTSVI